MALPQYCNIVGDNRLDAPAERGLGFGFHNYLQETSLPFQHNASIVCVDLLSLVFKTATVLDKYVQQYTFISVQNSRKYSAT